MDLFSLLWEHSRPYHDMVYLLVFLLFTSPTFLPKYYAQPSKYFPFLSCAKIQFIRFLWPYHVLAALALSRQTDWPDLLAAWPAIFYSFIDYNTRRGGGRTVVWGKPRISIVSHERLWQVLDEKLIIFGRKFVGYRRTAWRFLLWARRLYWHQAQTDRNLVKVFPRSQGLDLYILSLPTNS